MIGEWFGFYKEERPHSFLEARTPAQVHAEGPPHAALIRQAFDYEDDPTNPRSPPFPRPPPTTAAAWSTHRVTP